MNPPEHLDIQKDRGLTLHWADGRRVFYPVDYLRRMSPSAEAKDLRWRLAANPLTVLPGRTGDGPLRIVEAELRGNYALWIRFSDGHATGIYSWEYLKEIEPRA